MHFVLPIFLLFFSLFHPLEACLKVESSVTTTTAIPSCNNCLFVPLDADNIETYIGDHPSYPNIRNHEIVPPNVQRDECSLSLSCPSDYSLVALSDTNYQEFNQFSLEAVCDKYSRQWTIGGSEDYAEIFPQLYGVCLKVESSVTTPIPTCNECLFVPLDANNIETIIGNHPSYPNIREHGVIPPNVQKDGCTLYLSCPSDFSLVTLSDIKYRVYTKLSTEALCVKDSREWIVGGAGDYVNNYLQLYAVCVTVESSETTTTTEVITTPISTCNDCLFVPLDADNIETIIGNHPSYPNIREHGVNPPIVQKDGCTLYLSCPSDYSLVTLSDTKYRVYTKLSTEALCVKDSGQWIVGGAGDYVNNYLQLYAVCVTVESSVTTTTLYTSCGCKINSINDNFGSSFYGYYPFLETNVSYYRYYTADLHIPETGCVSHVTCDAGLTMVIMGDQTVVVQSGEAFVECSSDADYWTITYDGNSYQDVPNIQFTCVDYSKTVKCPCTIATFDNNDGHLYSNDFPFLESNTSQYKYYPAQLELNDQGCAEKVSCDRSLTMVILSRYTVATGYPETRLSCDYFNNDIIVQKGFLWFVYTDTILYQMNRDVKYICVDFARKLDCPCMIDTVNNKLGPLYYEDYPFLETNISHGVYYTAELQVGASGCVEKASCPSEQIMAILGEENTFVKDGEASLTCSVNDGVTLSYDGITRQERSSIIFTCIQKST